MLLYCSRRYYSVGKRVLTNVPYNRTSSVIQAVIAQVVTGAPIGLTFSAALYYPALYSGRNSPVLGGSEVFPLVVLAEGWTCFLEIVRIRCVSFWCCPTTQKNHCFPPPILFALRLRNKLS